MVVKKDDKYEIGSIGEEIVCKYMVSHGQEIINWDTRGVGKSDIVTTDYLIQVKTSLLNNDPKEPTEDELRLLINTAKKRSKKALVAKLTIDDSRKLIDSISFTDAISGKRVDI